MDIHIDIHSSKELPPNGHHVQVANQEHPGVDATRILRHQELRLSRGRRGLGSHGRAVSGDEVSQRGAEVGEEGIAVDEEDPILGDFGDKFIIIFLLGICHIFAMNITGLVAHDIVTHFCLMCFYHIRSVFL